MNSPFDTALRGALEDLVDEARPADLAGPAVRRYRRLLWRRRALIGMAGVAAVGTLAIPYAVLGALFGHLIMDITPSYLSIFGLLALAGVAINDSLVMVDFINQRRRSGMDLFEAVIQSGTRRFRPIFLTSATTFVGLIPTIFDKSPEAQFLNPMAVSIGFGMLFGTFITLLLVPSAYLAVEDIVVWVKKGIDWYKKPFTRKDEPEAPEEAAV